MIATQLLRLPVLTKNQALRALEAERQLKAGFDPAEARDERGRWTDFDSQPASAGKPNPILIPASAQIDETRAKKERFVDAHLADAQAGARQLHVPVENILGVSAYESAWGQHPFAIEGNIFLGIHYPAPYSTGYTDGLYGCRERSKSGDLRQLRR